ncbi:MAG: hypothetical protein KGJ31_00460 [Patescibacteria group bacterium]|nr:hypothetical protein [Patescibacteria group bacterium]
MTHRFSTVSFAGGIAFGIMLASAWFLTGGLVPLQVSYFPSLATSTPPASAQSGAISVIGQHSGNTVIVESVTVPPPGVWVAVREMSGNNLGNVLGAVRAGGPRTNISVPLLRATEPNRTYAVELYRDDSNGPFDLAADSVYVDFDTGRRVVAYFTTTE